MKRGTIKVIARLSLISSSAPEERPIKLQITDEASHTYVLRLDLSQEELGRLIAGPGDVECTALLYDNPHVGCIRQTKHIILRCSDEEWLHDKSVLTARAQMQEYGGWKHTPEDLKNWHRRVPGGVRVLYVRYVDPLDPASAEEPKDEDYRPQPVAGGA